MPMSAVVVIFAGMFLGLFCCLAITRFISSRFVSDQTHQAWSDALEHPYFPPRYPGVTRLFIWALLPRGGRPD
jgi:hypothetical protein